MTAGDQGGHMWLTEFWFYTTTGPDASDDSDGSAALRVGFLESGVGWREWTFPLDDPNVDDREKGRTDFYRLPFGPDDRTKAAEAGAGEGPSIGSTSLNGFIAPPEGPRLAASESLDDARSALSRLVVVLDYKSDDRWSLLHYMLVARVSYIEYLPVNGHPKRGSRLRSAKTVLAHGEGLGPDSARGLDHRGMDFSTDPSEGRRVFILPLNGEEFPTISSK